MTRVYYKEAAGAFVVFDVTRSSTYEAVKIWKKDLDSKCFMTDGSPVPAVLLGNKCDLPSETPGAQQMEDFCKENNFLAYFPTSAKEDLGISDAARCLVAQILKREENFDGVVENDKEGQVRLEEPAPKKQGGCCGRS
jgi:Ras-related protein Rab-32